MSSAPSATSFVERAQTPVTGSDFPKGGVDGLALGGGAEFLGCFFQGLVVEVDHGTTHGCPPLCIN
jgi:hypothetical protein